MFHSLTCHSQWDALALQTGCSYLRVIYNCAAKLAGAGIGTIAYHQALALYRAGHLHLPIVGYSAPSRIDHTSEESGQRLIAGASWRKL